MKDSELQASVPESLPGVTGEISADTPDVANGIPIDETTGGGQPGAGENTDNPFNNLNPKKKMASKSETGHAKNVANYASLTQICVSLGAAYKPSNAALKVPAMQTMLTNGQQAISRVTTTYQPYALAVAARQDAFQPVSQLVTKIYSALVSSGAPQSVIEIALTTVRKLQGRRASDKLTEEEKQAILAETGQQAVEHSSSQKSMDSNINFFEQLITLLTSIPEYAPNETELQLTTLQALLTNLKTKNEDVMPLEAPLTQARAQRTQVLYTPVTGLVANATKVKAYLKSSLGISSPIYKQATSLTIKKIT